MKMVSKQELRETLSKFPKEQIIDLLHNAWSELYRIDVRVKSVWHMDQFFYKERLQEYEEILKGCDTND